MTNHLEFTQDKLEMLIELRNECKNLQSFKAVAEIRIETLENKTLKQEKIINNMLWTGSKVALCFASISGGVMWLGYWLTDKLHLQAVTDFFNALKGK